MSEFKQMPVFESHGSFLRSVIEMLFKTVVFGVDKKSKVIEWKNPEELKNILDIEVNNIGVNHGALLRIIESTIKYSVKTGHPFFLNQLFSGYDNKLVISYV